MSLPQTSREKHNNGPYHMSIHFPYQDAYCSSNLPDTMTKLVTTTTFTTLPSKMMVSTMTTSTSNY